MAKRCGPVLPYPLTADEAAILAMAQQQRRAEDAGVFLGKLFGLLSWFRKRTQPRTMAGYQATGHTPLDTRAGFH